MYAPTRYLAQKVLTPLFQRNPFLSHLKESTHAMQKQKTNPYLPSDCTLTHYIISVKGDAPPKKEYAIQNT